MYPPQIVFFLTLVPLFLTQNSKKCYSCQGNCTSTSDVTECSSPDDKCFAFEFSQNGIVVQSKGCLSPNLAESLCNDNSKCYTCDYDLCNTITDPGVKECYVCIDECLEPPQQHNCQKVLTASEGRIVKAACLSYEIKNGDEVAISKGCIHDDSAIRSTCLYSNTLYPQVTCKICDNDLCNGKEIPDEDSFVEECYYCNQVCDGPLQTQKCVDVVGQGVSTKCAALEVTYGSEKYEFRGCVEDNAQIQANCTLLNQIGGNCTLCDTNLCNSNHKEINSVDECYHCETDCDEVEILKCKDVLGDKAAKCIAAVIIDDEKIEWRGCVEDSEENRNDCDTIKEQGGNCTICDTNLCNHKENGGGDDDTSEEEENNSSLRNKTTLYVFLILFLIKFA
ncbi:uncharacterized skeletal organic matrix protein 2-like isoform X2 [Tribolium madens]|uniref:uncharacterized skeletal organic matrix protein 2-like isoform X2 n=1 Tax=Tribolium madens TaxID=41895 RepID=UPI001CF74A20|nr:uncharacterized skeletal organic matrix protein 2-like isoform X2 [Tribolium madens]